MIQKYLCIILLCLTKILCNDLKQAQNSHKAKELTDDQVEVISQLSDISHFNKLLDEILIPRVVGTPNHTKVKEFLIAQLEKNDWDVELDTFEDLTPRFGKLEFTNVVGRLNPNAKRYLSLACHYDSKYTREGDFVGATDSAVPCAMMLNLIYVMKPYLDQIKQNDDVSLELIFFDGEEAFNQWSHTDSIYGARHLAAKRHDIRNRPNDLEKMDMLVLLDLLGTPDPMFYSYFMPTEKWYIRLVNAEHRLGKLGLFDNYSNGKPEQRYFQPRSMPAGIEDDHLPFLQRNVPILHIIPIPFPNEWHKSSDNRDAIDIHTIENLNKIFRVFVAEYLHLNV